MMGCAKNGSGPSGMCSEMSCVRSPAVPEPASATFIAAVSGGVGTLTEDQNTKNRCQFWLPNKRRLCANVPLPSSLFCGNHNPSAGDHRIPCPVDPSHSVLRENLDSHIRRCPLRKQAQSLESQPYYAKGINGGIPDSSESDTSSEEKRNAIYSLTVPEFHHLVRKIESIRSSISIVFPDSYVVPDACDKWLKRQIDRRLPYQEKHVKQQAAILGNMEAFGVLRKPDEELMQPMHDMGEDEGEAPAVVEFGAGRGYLTHMLVDCYRIRKVFLVERRSYKLKADRNLRQIQTISLERLRIDIEDLNLHGIESLMGLPYLAVGKHLCGPATDLAIRCCLPREHSQEKEILSSSTYLQGLALATCCHHLCQWKHYINKSFLSKFGVTKEDFNAITWFSSWAVDADHSSDLSHVADQGVHLHTSETRGSDVEFKGIEEAIRGMRPVDRAVLGFICKEIIDIGRQLWLREHGLDAQVVKYVPSSVSPENHLLVATFRPHSVSKVLS